MSQQTAMRAELESVLRLSRNRFRALVDAIPLPVCVLDEGLRVDGANHAYAELQGKHPREAIGESPGHPQCEEPFPPRVADLARTALQTGEVGSNLMRLRARGGGELWLEVVAAPLPDEDDSEPRVALMLRDVTQRVEMERRIQRQNEELEGKVRQRTAELERTIAQLRETEALKRDLFNMIVHDLKAPLAAMMGNLELLLEFAALEGKAREHVESAHAASDDMALMIGNLLDVERMEGSRMRMQFAPIAPDALVRRAVERLAVHARLHGVQLLHQPDGELPPLVMDGALIERVVRNLLMNAIEHSPEGESVRVALEFNDAVPGLLLCVEDRGPGIPEEERGVIFQKFRQGRDRSNSSGAGLGLAFCKMAVEAHHGTIRVEPASGRGSRFIVELPLLGMEGEIV
ncbi:MAG: ATP-binding protein [Candidatus Sumerlaeota bacterium]|nr:ATP-binding protein [Candidatus Sumerlaeota bacterium]